MPTPKYRSKPLVKEPSTPPPGWKPTPKALEIPSRRPLTVFSVKEPPSPPPGWQPAATEAVLAPSFLFDAREPLKSLAPKLRKVRVDDIEFTQDTCADHFSDGRRCDDTLKQLLRGEIRLDAEWLTLDVVETSSGVLASFNNRRLRMLKTYQKFVQQQRPGDTVTVEVRCRVRTMEADFESVLEQLYKLQHKETFQQQKELFRNVLFHRDSEYRGEIHVRCRNNKRRRR